MYCCLLARGTVIHQHQETVVLIALVITRKLEPVSKPSAPRTEIGGHGVPGALAPQPAAPACANVVGNAIHRLQATVER